MTSFSWLNTLHGQYQMAYMTPVCQRLGLETTWYYKVPYDFLYTVHDNIVIQGFFRNYLINHDICDNEVES